MKQFNDWVVLSTYIGYAFLILNLALGISMLCGLIEFSFEIASKTFFMGAIIIALNALILLLFGLYLKWKYPLPDRNSMYNPLSKRVELHLGRTGSLKSSLDVIMKANMMKKDVYFVTDHISKESLIKILRKQGYEGDVSEATMLQKILYIPISAIFKKVKGAKSKGHKCIQCIVYTSKNKETA